MFLVFENTAGKPRKDEQSCFSNTSGKACDDEEFALYTRNPFVSRKDCINSFEVSLACCESVF
jgi:hypothetical protein